MVIAEKENSPQMASLDSARMCSELPCEIN